MAQIDADVFQKLIRKNQDHLGSNAENQRRPDTSISGEVLAAGTR